ncbi:hypothetical protein BD626DRAFT_493337 [Schizophyllum amplum]|uniref:Zn(2)-C6 fungal-type domain-containing protein n=1 Tax=Schizophyllum amplum TaxID=97359 RepID=A0A550CGP9_9AGAR|nr:hypothetical protein BD626DRAFT_493337 [Auriculariopsis ampla]
MESRKQNTACDACRSRKVKCNKPAGADRCVHCAQKNLDCTHYQQHATANKKRTRPESNNNNTALSAPPSASAIPPSAPPSDPPPITAESPVPHVLAQLLAEPDGGYAVAWGAPAAQLADPRFRLTFAADLAEVFLQIVHPRMPLLNPTRLRSQLAMSGPTPPHPALLAAVLSWGAKFSEHPLMLADRDAHVHSALAADLIDRTRMLAEALAVHRIPTPDHILASLLLEPLQSQDPRDPTAFHGFWLRAAIHHLLELRVNHKATILAITVDDMRGTMLFAWWMACLADAYGSAYYRRKPLLDDDDYDIDFYTSHTAGLTKGLGQDSENAASDSDGESIFFDGYYRAAHALARVARTMSRRLWTPAAEAGGIPRPTLLLLVQALGGWRAAHYSAVGVPRDFGRGWGFVEAVSTCASDATFHVMWVILFGAVDEFGVKEFANSPDPTAAIEDDEVCRNIADEALHGALRIAGLAAVLTQNGYLRLDPAVMHVSCIHAGGLLARLGRPEVQHCIEGLEQYAHAYSEAGEQAEALRAVYEGVVSGHSDMQANGNSAYRQAYGNGQRYPNGQGQSNGQGLSHGRTYSSAQAYNEQYFPSQEYGYGANGQGYAQSHARSLSPQHRDMSPNGQGAAGPSSYGAGPSSHGVVPSSHGVVPSSTPYAQTSYARSSSTPAEQSSAFAGPSGAYPSSASAYPSASSSYPNQSLPPSSAAAYSMQGVDSAPADPLQSLLAAQGFPLHPHARGFPTGGRGLRWMQGAARGLRPAGETVAGMQSGSTAAGGGVRSNAVGGVPGVAGQGPGGGAMDVDTHAYEGG